MHSRTENYVLDRSEVYAMLTKEDQYATGWAVGKTPAIGCEAFPAHAVDRLTGEPFAEIEWVNFAMKYLKEFHDAHANYCPDRRALRIRMLKAASLLVTGLQVHGAKDDIARIAGVSSTKFPVLGGGLKTFQESDCKQTSESV